MSFEKINDACRLIEVEGIEGYQTASQRFGKEVADLLLIAHLRRSHGAMTSYPPDPTIIQRVLADLEESGLADRVG